MTNEELVDQIQNGISVSENMEQLYMKNKGLIYITVKKYRYACQSGYNSLPIIEMDELMHEAYFGLIKATESFNVNQGSLFMSYASFWIRQYVKRYLENCGQVVRVPVHRQQQIYQYNEARSFYLRYYNKEPNPREYARWLNVSENVINNLEKFMFQSKIRSLDAPLLGEENESTTLADTVTSKLSIENDIVEKVAMEQIKSDLWNIVSVVLRDEKLIKIIKLRYVNKCTLKEIGAFIGISNEQVRQYEEKALKKLRNNSRTKHLGKELGLFEESVNRGGYIDMERIKRWIDSGHENMLEVYEKQYAISMGWIKEK